MPVLEHYHITPFYFCYLDKICGWMYVLLPHSVDAKECLAQNAHGQEWVGQQHCSEATTSHLLVCKLMFLVTPHPMSHWGEWLLKTVWEDKCPLYIMQLCFVSIVEGKPSRKGMNKKTIYRDCCVWCFKWGLMAHLLWTNYDMSIILFNFGLMMPFHELNIYNALQSKHIEHTSCN